MSGSVVSNAGGQFGMEDTYDGFSIGDRVDTPYRFGDLEYTSTPPVYFPHLDLGQSPPFYDADWMKNLGLNIPVAKEPVIDTQQQFADDLDLILEEVEIMLIEKNRKYGDSALNPSRVFARSDAIEQIKVRIDDKLTRLKNQQNDEDEDVVMDLLGYLVILRVAQKRAKASEDGISTDT